MAQITSGKVSVEDSKPHSNDEYGRKKVLVELSFAVGEGESYEATFDLASEAASNRVLALLNGTNLRTVAAASTPAAEGTAASGEAKPPRKRRTAAEIAAAAAAGASTTGASGGAQTSDEDPTGNQEHVIHLPDEGAVDDPAAIGEDEFSIEPEAEAGEEEFNIEPDAGDEPITDADLNNAVQKKNAEIANPNAIRAIISSYNPDPKQAFQLRQIPADKRAEFLTKLGALKKAA